MPQARKTAANAQRDVNRMRAIVPRPYPMRNTLAPGSTFAPGPFAKPSPLRFLGKWKSDLLHFD